MMKTKCLLILCPITVHVYKYGKSLAQNRTHAYKTQKNNNEFELSTQERSGLRTTFLSYKNTKIVEFCLCEIMRDYYYDNARR